MAITKKEFKRFSKKEIVGLIKEHSLNIDFNSKTSKNSLVDMVFANKTFKSNVRKTLTPKPKRQISEKQRENLKKFQAKKGEFQSYKQQREALDKADKNKVEDPENREIPPEVASFSTKIQNERVQPNLPHEKLIKTPAQYAATISKFEGVDIEIDPGVEPGVKSKTQEEKLAEKVEQQAKHKKNDDAFGSVLTQFPDDESIVRANGQHAKKNRKRITELEDKHDFQKDLNSPFLSEVEFLTQKDPENPMITFIQLLDARRKERTQQLEDQASRTPGGVVPSVVPTVEQDPELARLEAQVAESDRLVEQTVKRGRGRPRGSRTVRRLPRSIIRPPKIPEE